MKLIDLNVDVGEGYPHDADIFLFASSANIGCGEHAGSWGVTRETIGLALDSGVRIGMHPGYPDRASMGRVSPAPNDLAGALKAVEDQIERFFNFVPAAYLKPHGALYSDSQIEKHPSWKLLRKVCRRFSLPFLGLPGTAHESISEDFLKEGFCDRAYDPRGRLVPRSAPGALLQEPKEIVRQTLRLAKQVDSLCLHGDTPNCVEFAELIYTTLLENGYEIGAIDGA